VAQEIRVQVTPQERALLTSAARVNPAAHEEYLIGRYHRWKYIEEDQIRAIRHFERAIAIDPTYAAPYAGLAHVWWARGVLGPLDLAEVVAPARAAAHKALELDARLPEAHSALAYVQGIFDWDWVTAERSIRRALELDRSSVDAYYIYALLLMALGRLDEATAHIRTAAALDPLSAQVQSTFGRILYRARRFDEAIVHLHRAIELEPRNAGAYARLGDVYDQMGDYAQALTFFERARVVEGSNAAYAVRKARVSARMGRVEEARRAITNARNASEVYAALGDKDRTFDVLLKSVANRQNWVIFIKADPLYDSLHSDPRWKELLRRMNLPASSPDG
jgi:tetratricopeptide (TPR) repeat protein